MNLFPPIDLIYDGECRFCIRSLRVLKAFDVFNRVRLVASDTPALFERYPQLLGADLDAAMYGVAGGRTYRGFDAFRRALWSTPVLAVMAWTWYVPPVPYAGRRIYAFVASRRSRLGCAI